MSRVIVDLTKENYERLAQLARVEHRMPPAQAAWLLERQIERLAKQGRIREPEPAT